jgi:hypothetical protein
VCPYELVLKRAPANIGVGAFGALEVGACGSLGVGACGSLGVRACGSLEVGACGSFKDVNRPSPEADRHLLLVSTQRMRVCVCGAVPRLPQYIFIEWCLISIITTFALFYRP